MRLLPVLFIITSIEAKRRRFDKDQVNINRKMKTNGVDVYPERFEAMDFGHVYRNGNKEPINDNEPDMNVPRDLEHARQLLRDIGSDIVNVKKLEEPQGFANPRDALKYKMLAKPVNGNKNIDESAREQRPPRVNNITQANRKLVEEELKKKVGRQWSNIQDRPYSDVVPSGIKSKDNDDRTYQFFSKSSFDLMSDEKNRLLNWTTCKEFGRRAVFYPDDVINMQWVPFFIWSTRRFVTSVVHTLKYPTKKLVRQYKEKFGPYLNMRVNWEEPKLLLKEATDMLLIAGDRKGLFYGIPYIELPSPITDYKIKLTVLTVRLKIVDPYLAMMYCNENYATIMSVAGTEPETDEAKTTEAAILNFQGIGHPASRDLEHEKRISQYEIEKQRRLEESKYIKVEKPDDRLDPSLW